MKPLKQHIMNAMGRVSDARRQAVAENRDDVLNLLLAADKKLAQALGEVEPVTPTHRFPPPSPGKEGGVARPFIVVDHQLAEDCPGVGPRTMKS